MNILAVLLNVLISVNEIFWLYQWVNVIAEKKRPMKFLEPVLYMVYVVTVLSLNQIALTSPYTMAVIIVQNFLAVLIFWKSDLIQAFAAIGGYFAAMFVIGNIEITLTGMIGGEELIVATTSEHGVERVLYLLIFGSLWLFLNKYLVSYIRKKNISRKSLRYVGYVSIIGIIGSAFLGKMMLESFGINIGVVWYVFLAAIAVLICYFYFLIKKKDMQIQMSFLETQNEMLERNYTQVNEFYTTNAKLYHDMNHHFDAIYYMLQQGRQDQAKDYIESLRSPEHYAGIQVQSGINVVDAILHEMKVRAQQKGITMNMEIMMLPSDMGIEKKDLCSMFVNLLENALEAASREISVQIKKVNQTLFVTVKNDCPIMPQKKNGRFVTTKEEKNMHGWGTQIVEQIAQKYDGSIEYETENGK